MNPDSVCPPFAVKYETLSLNVLQRSSVDVSSDLSSNSVLIITLNRPKVLNAFNLLIVSELHSVFDLLAHPAQKIRVVILTGAGAAFCAGADLSQNSSFEGYTLWMQRRTASLISKIHSLPQIFVAAINGAAAGAGFSVALACDLRVAVRSARMNCAFVRMGLSGAEMGSSYHLPRLVGIAVANELMLTGRFIAGDRAYQLGLVNEVYDDSTAMMNGALQLCDDILRNSYMGIKLTKEAARASWQTTLESALAMEDRQQLLCMADAEAMEVGVRYATKFLKAKL